MFTVKFSNFSGPGDYIDSVSGSSGDYDLTLRSGEVVEGYDETAGLFSTAAPIPGDLYIKNYLAGPAITAAVEQVIPAALAYLLCVTRDMATFAVDSISPADEAEDVAVDANIVITLNRKIASKTDASIVVDAGAGALTTVKSISGNVLTINPSSNFSNDDEVTVTLTEGYCVDDQGNDAPAATYTFTVVSAG
jgi:hypothetical protein